MISTTTVRRIWTETGLKPHRNETFEFGTAPDLAAKTRNGVGLYLDSPERAIVLAPMPSRPPRPRLTPTPPTTSSVRSGAAG